MHILSFFYGHLMQQTCLGIVGWSGSGKTTLLEQLVQHLVQADYKIGVIKHSHHDVILEPEHKDTARLRRAGAAQVMLASPYRIALVDELRERKEPNLAELLARLDPADLVLVEGYKWAAIPKLEVWRPALGKPALYRDDAWIKVVASDSPRPNDGLHRELLWLDLNDVLSILSFVRGLIDKSDLR